jgi:hypothetical protein
LSVVNTKVQSSHSPCCAISLVTFPTNVSRADTSALNIRRPELGTSEYMSYREHAQASLPVRHAVYTPCALLRAAAVKRLETLAHHEALRRCEWRVDVVRGDVEEEPLGAVPPTLQQLLQRPRVHFGIVGSVPPPWQARHPPTVRYGIYAE